MAVVGKLAKILLPVSLAVSLVACRTAPSSPEDDIRALISEMERAAEDKDIARLKEAISDRYSDPEGRNKNILKGFLARYLLQHRSVHLLVRVDFVNVKDPAAAAARLLVAMAGRDIEDVGILPTLRADLYLVDVELAREGDGWRVTSAAWEQASLEDFGAE
jgi:hypothetical protein